jgi:hypothetical protein
MAWSYTERVSEQRQRTLLAARRFRTIINRVLDEMQVTRFEVIAGRIGAVKGCARPEFTLKVRPDTLDLFFNSARGYRAQYHDSREAGERANSDLISRMSDRLVNYADEQSAKHKMSMDAIRHSLNAKSAKIWINEHGARAQNLDYMRKLPVELEVEPWLSTAKAYVSDPSKYPNLYGEILAVDGVRAPTGTILEVKGAFIDDGSQERFPENKKNRSVQIHLYGFT